MQTPYAVRLGDGTRIVVWASNEELFNLRSIEDLGQKCLLCENDYLCFELSRSRDFCLARDIQVG